MRLFIDDFSDSDKAGRIWRLHEATALAVAGDALDEDDSEASTLRVFAPLMTAGRALARAADARVGVAGFHRVTISMRRFLLLVICEKNP